MSKPCLILHNWAEGKQSSTFMAAGKKTNFWHSSSPHDYPGHCNSQQLTKQNDQSKPHVIAFPTEADIFFDEITEKSSTTHFFPRQMEPRAVRSTPRDKSHSRPHMINSANSRKNLSLCRQHVSRMYYILPVLVLVLGILMPGHLHVLSFNFFF